MRIIFVNLHTNEFLVKTASKYIFKQAVAMKHQYLLDYLINNPEIEVCSYINKHGTSIASNLPKFLMKIIIACRYLESKWVLKKNGIYNKITIIKKVEDIHNNDIIILYQLYANKCKELKNVNAFKVMSLLHFFGNRANSEDIKECSPHFFINECDLKSHCELFKKYYSWITKDIYVYPFVAAQRFQNNNTFEERKKMVFSTGTITYKNHPEFIDVYGNPCDQPMRKYVKDNQEKLKGLIDCYNSDFSEDSNKKMSIKSSDNKLIKLTKAGYYKFFASQQKKYFSFNMVDKFNDYQMCLIGEEILGIPGIGFVEGMSCGCAYIGKKGYYEDYGMKDGIHYIGYNGTPEDLIDKIHYYQQSEHQQELKQIALNGYQFAIGNFKGEIVAKRLIDIIMERHNVYISSNKA